MSLDVWRALLDSLEHEARHPLELPVARDAEVSAAGGAAGAGGVGGAAGAGGVAGAGEDAGAAATASAGVAWAPPAEAGPLPAQLADRAREVAVAQKARAADLRAEMRSLRTHLEALAMIPALRSDAAAYVERDG